MNAVYVNVLLRDVLAHLKREAASRLSSPEGTRGDTELLRLGERASRWFADGTRTNEPLDLETAIKCLDGALGALEASSAPAATSAIDERTRNALEVLSDEGLTIPFCRKCDPEVGGYPADEHDDECPRLAARNALAALASPRVSAATPAPAEERSELNWYRHNWGQLRRWLKEQIAVWDAPTIRTQKHLADMAKARFRDVLHEMDQRSAGNRDAPVSAAGPFAPAAHRGDQVSENLKSLSRWISYREAHATRMIAADQESGNKQGRRAWASRRDELRFLIAEIKRLDLWKPTEETK